MSSISIKNLTKKFGKTTVLENFNAEILEGKIVGLVGPDGAGKTTLIRLMAALMKPTDGKITLKGYDTYHNQDKVQQIIGYMPQKFGLYEDLSVIENMNLYADLRNVIGQEKKEIFETLLKFTGLKPFIHRFSGRLSGGMKQKLGLACALMCRPEILLLDEPSVGVDPISRRELWKMVKELSSEGVTVVWSTAYLDEAEKCDDVFLLNEGKLLFHGLPGELTKRVDKRVYKITQIHGRKREVLRKALKEESVIDGVIQGSEVRLVFQHQNPTISLIEGAKLIPTTPRFEDAFLDILGGGPKGDSKIAELTPEIPKQKNLPVEAKHLTKKFGEFTAAQDISFEIQRGEIFGLLGPNGAGKTTTFKMMCGLLKPTNGESFVNGLNLQKTSGMARAHIGYMAQKFSLYGTISAYQNLRFFSGVYNLTGSKRNREIQSMIDIFMLKPYANTSADLLPLGFKQRLALSCSLMHQPSILFLDEPTSGVDPITRREFWQHINGIVEKGVTVIVTTHFMDEAEYCDRIALIYKSQLIEIGTPDELKKGARTKGNPSPTLEDAFISSIESFDRENSHDHILA